MAKKQNILSSYRNREVHYVMKKKPVTGETLLDDIYSYTYDIILCILIQLTYTFIKRDKLVLLLIQLSLSRSTEKMHLI